VEGTIWIYDGTQYQSFTQAITHEIPMGQGFIIHATGSSPAITIPALQRDNSHPLFLKSSKSSIGAYKNALIIKVQNNRFEDKVQISFGDSATDGFDNGWDGSKMFGSDKAPQLYLVQQGIDQSYDYLPTLTEGKEKTVAMSYIPGAAGTQEFTADFVNLGKIVVSLEDLKTGKVQDLNKNHVYTFTGSKADNPARFLLHFNASVTGINETPKQNASIRIYSFGKDVYIRLTDKVAKQNGNVIVYDLLGRKLAEKQITGAGLVKFPVDIAGSYVVVRVVKGSSVKTKKVFIK
jgi:hypothetical protein